MKQEPVDTEEELDSNKIEEEIDISVHWKSEITDDGENEEKQDVEKDVEEDVADMLQNDVDIKLEDLEEENNLDEKKEVGFDCVIMGAQWCVLGIRLLIKR